MTDHDRECLRRDKIRRLLSDDRRACEFVAAHKLFGGFGLFADPELGTLIVESGDYWANGDRDLAAA